MIPRQVLIGVRHANGVAFTDHATIVSHSSINARRSLQRPFSRLDAYVIVYGTPDPLFTAQVSFCRLYGNVAQQKLYLLQLTCSRMAEPRAAMPRGEICRVARPLFLLPEVRALFVKVTVGPTSDLRVNR